MHNVSIKFFKRYIMRTIIIFLFVFLFLVLSLPFLGIEWIYSKLNRRSADFVQLRTVQGVFKVVLFLSGAKITVTGKENIPDKDEAVLYVCNHLSIFDIIATYSMCPGLTGYISKNSIKKVPILSLWMKRLYCLFLNRDDVKEGLKTILTAIDYVKSGVSICIFPEGTRNKDSAHPEKLLPFKDGSFKIAQKTGCKIVPIAIKGTAEIFEDHFPWIKSHPVTVSYGTPIELSSLSKEDSKHIGAYVQKIVLQMLLDMN